MIFFQFVNRRECNFADDTTLTAYGELKEFEDDTLPAINLVENDVWKTWYTRILMVGDGSGKDGKTV